MSSDPTRSQSKTWTVNIESWGNVASTSKHLKLTSYQWNGIMKWSITIFHPLQPLRDSLPKGRVELLGYVVLLVHDLLAAHEERDVGVRLAVEVHGMKVVGADDVHADKHVDGLVAGQALGMEVEWWVYGSVDARSWCKCWERDGVVPTMALKGIETLAWVRCFWLSVRYSGLKVLSPQL